MSKRAASAPPPAGWKLQFLRRWFGRGPRAHGEIILGRRVNPVELLYDLVYAAVIAQAGRHLADQISSSALVVYALVFSLTWIAWVNGTVYLELHGRNDGRTRFYVFVQIGILALLAVFAGNAGGDGGTAFALTYASYLAVMTWLWYEVRLRDIAVGHPEFNTDTGRYVVTIAASVVVILISAFLPAPLRLVVWAAFTAAWIFLLLLIGDARVGLSRAMAPTDSLVDRFGTFVLIVLGEVVFGVVSGLSQSPHDLPTIATGIVALVIGFGFWWIYFDVVGGRLPNKDGRAIARWMLSHYPITLAIGAAGAGMVSLLEHTHDSASPASTSWLLAGAVAVGLAFVIPASRALADSSRLASAYRAIEVALAGGALVSLVVGWARPAPWLLALLLVTVLTLLWAVAVRGFVLAGDWLTDS